jgi:hypothetical protein
MSEATRAKLRAANTGERNHWYGRRAHNWKGGRVIDGGGYIDVWVDGRYVAEHRLVMERHLLATDPGSEFLRDGRLDVLADVHHENDIKTDNRLQNLVVMWKADHSRLHGERRRAIYRERLLHALDIVGSDHTSVVAQTADVPRTTARRILIDMEAEGLVRSTTRDASVRFPVYWSRS